AENVFAVTSSSPAVPPTRMRIDATLWREEHRAAPPPSSDAPALWHVSSGTAVPGCDLRIAGPDGRGLDAGPEGRVLIRSPFLLSGYFRREDLNAALLDTDGFLDTGDVGWLDGSGHLYVTGRLKDLVIVGGRNIYPQDVEQLANEVAGVHPG